MYKYGMKNLARCLALLILVFIGLPSLFVSILGFQELTDTSVRENQEIGRYYGGIFAAALSTTFCIFMFTRRPKC